MLNFIVTSNANTEAESNYKNITQYILQRMHSPKTRNATNTYQEIGELGIPIDNDREWEGFDDVNPNLSFIVDALTPLCRFKRFTISCRKSRNSTAYRSTYN